MQVQIDWRSPQIVIVKQLMRKEDCDQIISMAGKNLQQWHGDTTETAIRVMQKYVLICNLLYLMQPPMRVA